MHPRREQSGISTVAEEPISVVEFPVFPALSQSTHINPSFHITSSACENTCANIKNPRHASPNCRNKIFFSSACAELQPKILLLGNFQPPPFTEETPPGCVESLSCCQGRHPKHPAMRLVCAGIHPASPLAWSGHSVGAGHSGCPTWAPQNSCLLPGVP